MGQKMANQGGKSKKSPSYPMAGAKRASHEKKKLGE